MSYLEVAVSMTKHHDQKQLGGVCFSLEFYSTTEGSQSKVGGKSAHSLTQTALQQHLGQPGGTSRNGTTVLLTASLVEHFTD